MKGRMVIEISVVYALLVMIKTTKWKHMRIIIR
jgi:hypothetical protein